MDLIRANNFHTLDDFAWHLTLLSEFTFGALLISVFARCLELDVCSLILSFVAIMY